jgi:hypothetical protein
MNSILRFQPPPPPPPPRKTTGGSGWGGFRKLFGLGTKEESVPATNYYAPEVSYCTEHFVLDLF